MAEPKNGLGDHLRAVRERKLVQWTLAYVAGAWLLLQIFDVIAGQFGWPPTLGRALTVTLGIGLVAAVVLAWYHGEQGRQRVSAVELFMLAGIFAIAAAAVGAVSPDPGYGPATDDENSVAVLPFDDLSETQDQAYFSEGISEEILNRLAQLNGLRVAARTSSFSFKGKGVTIADVGRTLRVAHVLEGSVRRQGTKVRITAQLIKTDDGFHVWSHSYDRDVSDIFYVQDEIAGAIASALELKLRRPHAGKKPAAMVADDGLPRTTAGGEAHELYLRGLAYWHRRGVALDTALLLFEAAVRADSTYPQAWAGLANTYGVLALYRAPTWSELRTPALSAAYRALALNPRLTEAYAALGQIFRNELQLHAAEEALRQAIALSPSNADAYEDLALVHLTRGEHEAAARYARRAVELSPLSPVIQNSLALGLASSGAFEEAVNHSARALSLDPLYRRGNTHYATMLTYIRRYDDARAHVRMRGLGRHPERSAALDAAMLAVIDAHADSTLKPHARRALVTAAEAVRDGEDRRAIALMYGLLGERQLTIDALRRCLEQDGALPLLVRSALFAHLFDSAAYKAVVLAAGDALIT